MKARIPRPDYEKGFATGYKRGVRDTLKGVLASVDMTLKDKNGWTPRQIDQFTVDVNELFNSMYQDYLSLTDVEEAAVEEIFNLTRGSKES